jgi:hypothetical protein
MHNIQPNNGPQGIARIENAQPRHEVAPDSLQARVLSVTTGTLQAAVLSAGSYWSGQVGAGFAVRVGSAMIYEQARAASAATVMGWIPGVSAAAGNAAVSAAIPHLLTAGSVAGGGAFLFTTAVFGYAIPRIASSARTVLTQLVQSRNPDPVQVVHAADAADPVEVAGDAVEIPVVAVRERRASTGGLMRKQPQNRDRRLSL